MPGTEGHREVWSVGESAFFEYHCLQSHDSADAQAWYRSHQPVEVVAFPDSDGLKMLRSGADREERLNDGCPLIYRVRFSDGHEHDVFEDELMSSRELFSDEFSPPTADRRLSTPTRPTW